MMIGRLINSQKIIDQITAFSHACASSSLSSANANMNAKNEQNAMQQKVMVHTMNPSTSSAIVFLSQQHTTWCANAVAVQFLSLSLCSSLSSSAVVSFRTTAAIAVLPPLNNISSLFLMYCPRMFCLLFLANSTNKNLIAPPKILLAKNPLAIAASESQKPEVLFLMMKNVPTTVTFIARRARKITDRWTLVSHLSLTK